MKYERTSSGKTPEQIAEMKAKFRERVKNLPDDSVPLTTPPRYDDAYFEFIEQLRRNDEGW